MIISNFVVAVQVRFWHFTASYLFRNLIVDLNICQRHTVDHFKQSHVPINHIQNF